ncbi:tRNA1(Val) (adenine(37)-N6)-methyltransferase [Vibrio sp. VPAP30]|uniref:tRNA1(Val) (adenine(37)-N6)-methyltransferase n=1 Tax=Vibrio sp. VPAP30 TaxID=1647102 RepID=UPI000657AB5A|nr:methyltransferase [Vibrio sp. VPAP30]KLN64210.1 SAM-dependent methlyltransferase [Vibrio sp. VPAP30]
MNKTKDFDFKQFTIYGGYSGMPVSTDGVLLGAWVELSKSAHLLDIGTGTGLLSLMCAQRHSSLIIEAIDIDVHAIEAAQVNFSRSSWQKRLALHQGDILQYKFTRQFDRIICNPPYFNSGEQARNATRATARHTGTLTHKALLLRCKQLLTNKGKASFVLPKLEGEQFVQLAKTQDWHVSRLCQIKATERKEVSRLLIELTKFPTATVRESLTIHTDQGYSDTFIELTKDFYLKM